jgi:DNA-binding GntR family transcriptional regulator
MILDGVLEPGQQINEKALAENNGLSRAPIREACRRLEQAGLVEIIVNRGAFVRKIPQRDMRELCSIRLVLARHMGELAATQITPTALARLEELVGRIEVHARARDLVGFAALNREFHDIIIEAAGNLRLGGIYTAINKELRLLRWRALNTAPELEEALAAHRTILEALLARDSGQLADALEAHTRIANDRLLKSNLAEAGS